MRFRLGRYDQTLLVAAVAALSAAALAVPVAAAPQPGYRESFPGTSTAGWQGGTLPSNPGSGGVSGSGDGYLYIARSGFAGSLGAFAATPPYTGDWITAGITHVFLWLNDVNVAENPEIHFSLGDSDFSLPDNFWQHNVGFIPPHDRWAMFTVDLTDAGSFTQIIGSGTFAAALANTNKIHVRHDKAPFFQTPDAILGDVGVDELFLFAAGAAGVDPSLSPGATRPLELAPPAPNPARGPVVLRMVTYDGGPVRLEVVDVGGRAVRHAALPTATAGARSWVWDGADDAGRPTAPGVYRVRAFGPSGGMSRPLVRVR